MQNFVHQNPSALHTIESLILAFAPKEKERERDKKKQAEKRQEM